MPWQSDRPRSAEYGAAHARARAAAAEHHDPADPCTRCGQPLGPMGRHLHYDHLDDRSGYAGFAHASCNSRAGARKGRAAQATMARASSRPEMKVRSSSSFSATPIERLKASGQRAPRGDRRGVRQGLHRSRAHLRSH